MKKNRSRLNKKNNASKKFAQTRRREQIRRGKNVSGSKREEYVGEFLNTSRGFGFIKCDKFVNDIFVPAVLTKGAQGGDTVRFTVAQGYDNKTEGRVVEIIGRNTEPVMGHLSAVDIWVRRGGRSITRKAFDFIPDSTKRINFNVRISYGKSMGAKDGDRVAVKILEYPTRTTYAVGELVRVFGSTDTPESAVEAVLFSNGISTKFDDNVVKEADRLSLPDENEIADRLDLRDKTVFTIDSEYAKDLDDAISIERTENGWVLGVHIADVTHYVKPGSAIDKEAMRRTTSLYYPGNVVPMLPEKLSIGLCSLNKDTDKLTLSAIIELDSNAEIVRCEVVKSIISSAARGVYSELNAILDKSADKELKNKYSKEVIISLKEAYRLYKVLKRRADKRGCFELESDEALILLDEKGYPCDIQRLDRGVCERIIEQFMICANEAVARLTCARGLTGVYRVHEKPDPEKCSILLQYIENLGIDIKPLKLRADRLAPVHMKKILEISKEADKGRAVSDVLLRSLMKARYSPQALGHYGLALDYYSHFTSPIRRYADLTLHRVLKRTLKKGVKLVYDRNEDTLDSENCPTSDKVSEACEAANEGEIRAQNTERAIVDIYKAFYMRGHEGEEFDAFIVSVTSFGFFAELDNSCEGLVPVSELGGIESYDEACMCLVDVYGRKFTPGMRIRVCLEEVDLARGKLTFSLIDRYED